MDRRALTLLLLIAALAGRAAAATCPFNIPVVTIPPQQVAGYSWGNVIRPMGDACVQAIAVDPTVDSAWYAGSATALYVTKNNGATWTKPLIGSVQTLLVVRGQPNLVYAGIDAKLYLSRDAGGTWTLIHTFPKAIRSILVYNATLMVGLGWDDHINPSGVFVSNLGGGLMTFHPFGGGATGLIVWTLSRDPLSGAIYAGTEIFDHPKPYHPPFYRSTNNGVNWANVAGSLPWHVIDSAVRPTDGLVYALTEGLGVYRSANQGATWHAPLVSPGLGDAMAMDPKTPTRLYIGRQNFGTLNGGLFLSINSGATAAAIGLAGVTISDVALNGSSTRVYAAAYASGIYTSAIP